MGLCAWQTRRGGAAAPRIRTPAVRRTSAGGYCLPLRVVLLLRLVLTAGTDGWPGTDRGNCDWC
eukprot:389577-Rhodomonas_salina.3